MPLVLVGGSNIEAVSRVRLTDVQHLVAKQAAFVVAERCCSFEPTRVCCTACSCAHTTVVVFYVYKTIKVCMLVVVAAKHVSLFIICATHAKIYMQKQ